VSGFEEVPELVEKKQPSMAASSILVSFGAVAVVAVLKNGFELSLPCEMIKGSGELKSS